MSRYCGVCGASLGMTSLTTGRCEQCNARVETADFSIDERHLASGDAPTLAGRGQEAAGDPAYTHSSSQALPGPGREFISAERPLTPAPKVEARGRSRRESPRVPLLWVLSLLLVVALLLASGALVLLARNGSIPIVIAPFTSSNANANSSSNSSSGIPGGGATATSSGTSQGQGGQGGPGGTSTQPASGTATTSRSPSPTPSVGVGPTSTPTPPVLSVSPPGFSGLICLESTATFTISNTGQAPLMWSASPSVSGYTISPGSGTVDGGHNETFTVSNILRSGMVTITAPGAINSPQQVTISCKLL